MGAWGCRQIPIEGDLKRAALTVPTVLEARNLKSRVGGVVPGVLWGRVLPCCSSWGLDVPGAPRLVGDRSASGRLLSASPAVSLCL